MEPAREAEILQSLKAKFGVEGEVQRTRRVWVSIGKERLLEVSGWMKEQGFEHLSSISVTDWLGDGSYELTYHLWSPRDKMVVTLRTRTSREDPSIASVMPVWDQNAWIHERELHELFGVKFEGNPDLAPLFLEDWEGPAPFRKDFDWREYTREKYYKPENEREHVYYE